MEKKRTKKDQCGACSFASVSPVDTKEKINTVNMLVGFEEALKLKAGVDECVSRLNSYNRATKKGKQSKMKIVVHFVDDMNRIRILES